MWNKERGVLHPTDAVFLITCQRVCAETLSIWKQRPTILFWPNVVQSHPGCVCGAEPTTKQTGQLLHVFLGTVRGSTPPSVAGLQQADRITAGNASESEKSVYFMSTLIFYSSV